MNLTEKSDVEKQLLSEEIDAKTFEDKAEQVSLLIDDEKDFVSEIVKSTYKKLSVGHAIIREKFYPIYALVLGMLFFGGLTVIILYGIIYWGKEGSFLGFIGFLPVFCSIGIGIFVCKRCYKIFDVYFCKYNGKRIVFYVNRKYSILYKNRRDYVCINSKGIKVMYDIDDFMNIKLGFNRLVGNMIIKNCRDGYVIKTTQFKNFTTSKYSGNSKLWVDKNFYAKKILIANKYFYRFIDISEKDLYNSHELELLLNQFSKYL